MLLVKLNKIPPLLGHWGRIIDVLYHNVGDLLLLHTRVVVRPNIYIYYSCILLCWGPPTVPRSRYFFFRFLVLDRHDYRVTACVHRRNTGRTSRIATLLCCLSVLASRVVILFRLC